MCSGHKSWLIIVHENNLGSVEITSLLGHFGTVVQRLRLEKNWEVEQLARQLGIVNTHLRQIEENRTSLSLDLAIKIARAFDISIDDLITMCFEY